MKPSIALNSIVKNESARIERMLLSVLPHVKAVTILDTGSTDNTIEIIERLCKDAGVYLTIGQTEFENFSQCRNEAFRIAKANNVADAWCQFALLMDADMELIVENRAALFGLDATTISLTCKQQGGSVSYDNTRLLNLNWGADPYVGVTHEYLNVPSAGAFPAIRFIDHADGANRVNKWQRDATLLVAALQTDPDNTRSHYYLGNSYLDGGQFEAALVHYDRVIELNGWDEEVHDAKMKKAWCELKLGNEDKFVTSMIEAYNFRPRRAEPLYELAKYYRLKGKPLAALTFAKQGTKIERPNDFLFVDDFIHSHGLRYEYSIAAFYDDRERNSAFQVTDDLALDPTCPQEQRNDSRSNLFWYTKPLKAYCPSFVDKHFTDLSPPPGYTVMNPSVEECNGVVRVNFRCVNYKIDEQGRYMIGPKECHDAPIDTRNYIATLDCDLNVQVAREIIWDRPQAKFDMVTGLEDIRLYRSKGDLCFSACIREQASNGTCQQIRGRLAFDIDNKYMTTFDTEIMSGEANVEKNWMPMPGDKFVYRLDRIIENVRGTSHEEYKRPAKIDVSMISGGSQLIPFRHGFLCVVHEASADPNTGKRTYWHRFAWFNHDGELNRLSLPFVFLDRQIEFCAGLCWSQDKQHLLISYGVRDEEAHIAKVAVEEVAQMIWKHHAD